MEPEDPGADTVIPLIKIIEAVAELAAIEGLDPVVSKLEEAVEELERTMSDVGTTRPIIQFPRP